MSLENSIYLESLNLSDKNEKHYSTRSNYMGCVYSIESDKPIKRKLSIKQNIWRSMTCFPKHVPYDGVSDIKPK
jgi:hypothetical protein